MDRLPRRDSGYKPGGPPAHIVRAIDALNYQHELSRPPLDAPSACRVAGRAAQLLGSLANPTLWAGCRVDVLQADTRRLVVSFRVPNPKGVRV